MVIKKDFFFDYVDLVPAALGPLPSGVFLGLNSNQVLNALPNIRRVLDQLQGKRVSKIVVSGYVEGLTYTIEGVHCIDAKIFINANESRTGAPMRIVSGIDVGGVATIEGNTVGASCYVAFDDDIVASGYGGVRLFVSGYIETYE